MEPRLNIITLGVTDLQRSLRFYRDGLGWKTSAASNEHIVFFPLGGVVLALFARDHLAADAALPPGGGGGGFAGFTVAQNARSKAEVDAALAAAVAAGATLLKPAAEVFWGGYSGYFADPDGFAWEVCWNPHFPLTDSGLITLP